MIICRPENVIALFTGELSENEAASIRDHVSSCHECQELSRHLKEIAKDLAELPAPRLSEPEKEAMYTRVVSGPPLVLFKAPAEPNPSQASERRHAKALLRAAVAFAGLLLLLVAAVSLGMFISSHIAHTNSARAQISYVVQTAPAREKTQQIGNNDPSSSAADANQGERPTNVGVEVFQNTVTGSMTIIRITPSGARVIWNYE